MRWNQSGSTPAYALWPPVSVTPSAQMPCHPLRLSCVPRTQGLASVTLVPSVGRVSLKWRQVQYSAKSTMCMVWTRVSVCICPRCEASESFVCFFTHKFNGHTVIICYAAACYAQLQIASAAQRGLFEPDEHRLGRVEPVLLQCFRRVATSMSSKHPRDWRDTRAHQMLHSRNCFERIKFPSWP